MGIKGAIFCHTKICIWNTDYFKLAGFKETLKTE